MTAIPYARRRAALCVLLVAEAMNLLDATIVQVAAPVIRTELGASAGQLQWLTAGYTLPFAVLLISGGRLGDLLGRRRVFATGLAVFVVCSALCACAPGIGVLLAARAVQGAGAALLVPQTFGLIRAMFTGRELSAALGTIGPVMALAAVAGPLSGGALTDAFGWRSVFLVNVPLGVAALLACPLLREDRSPHALRLDGLGTVLVAVATGLLVYPLVQGTDAGRPAWTWCCLAGGVLVLAGFAGQQRRAAYPLVEPGLFRDGVFPASLAGSLLFFAVLNGVMFVLVVFLASGGASAFGAGLSMLPWSGGLALGSLTTGLVLVPRFGARVMRAGVVLVVLGVAAVAVLLRVPAAAPAWYLAAPLLVAGVGLGVFTVPFFANALSRVAPHETGSASGLLNAVQQLGATVGVAVLGAAFFRPPHPTDGARLALGVALGLLATVCALTSPMLRRVRTPAA
ncbi:EmrB/QacA subfamily drug resistance transporter [Amycolatopsis bartoniae]|uniref:MFS transporter n=1 Tax=Amycolatopsis bartoniae TaxID=941986 RepID=A0A8H9MBB3_9PSEU|nr:MFS transporter [Amycolatopsis bartoniae]MBB2938314.1 EmrB/QacA subfamily drug resistance transporter [Amycolatopsis bartoniae]TVT01778.1 MFS transporter [Amycolatopsis bartoniae]GHF34257.1 MFS transporter [Amycolatopsis bartoniae]